MIKTTLVYGTGGKPIHALSAFIPSKPRYPRLLSHSSAARPGRSGIMLANFTLQIFKKSYKPIELEEVLLYLHSTI